MALVGKTCFELKLSQVNYSNGCIRIIYRYQPSPMVMSSIFKHFKLITFVILLSVQIIARHVITENHSYSRQGSGLHSCV